MDCYNNAATRHIFGAVTYGETSQSHHATNLSSPNHERSWGGPIRTEVPTTSQPKVSVGNTTNGVEDAKAQVGTVRHHNSYLAAVSRPPLSSSKGVARMLKQSCSFETAVSVAMHTIQPFIFIYVRIRDSEAMKAEAVNLLPLDYNIQGFREGARTHPRSGSWVGKHSLCRICALAADPEDGQADSRACLNHIWEQ